MGAAKYTIATQDKSVQLSSLDGIYAAAVVISDKGPTEPTLISGVTQFENKYGVAKPSNGPSQYGVKTYLKESNKIWINRAVHSDARYAAALVRNKVDSIPSEVPNKNWVPDLVIKPIDSGLTQSELKSFNFPLYPTDRVYTTLDTKIVGAVTDSKKLTISSSEKIKVGDIIYFGNDPKNDSPLHEITASYEEDVIFDKITLNKPVTVNVNEPVKMAIVEIKDYATPVEVKAEALANQNVITLDATTLPQIAENDNIVIKDKEYIVDSKNPDNNTITVRGVLSEALDIGTVIKKKTITDKEYQGSPSILRDGTRTNEILVTKSDYIGNGDSIIIGSNTPVEVVQKDHYKEVHNIIELDKPLTGNDTTVFNKMIHNEFEDKDSFLVTFSSLSKLGNEVSIAVTPSKEYTEADVTQDFSLPFNIVVFNKGVEVERFNNVSMNYQLDNFQNQMFIENRINGISEYINIKVNPGALDENGKLKNPLYTTYSIWRQLSEDMFWMVDDTVNAGSKVTITEDLLAGDTNVYVTDNTNLSLGDRIRFEGYNDEYKVINKASYTIGGKTIYDITLSRGVVITKDNALNKIKVGAKVTKFDASINNAGEGIFNGVKNFMPKKLNTLYYKYPLNVIIPIGELKGTMLDCGSNLLLGGSNGSPVTVGDVVRAFKPFYNKNQYPIQIVLDTGHTFPAVAQEINDICSARQTAHGYISIDLNAENRAEYLNSIVEYYNSLMLNSEYVSVFAGWVKILDENNSIELYSDPASAAAACQCFTTRNYQPFYPGAGWIRGRIKGLGTLKNFNEADMDYLVDNRINPIRYKEGSGMALWGNETTYRKPSPLQMRSVAWLLIMIKNGLESFLDFSLFEMNNQRTYEALETAIRVFMRDEIKAKGGVYDFACEVSSIITDLDKEQRRIPVFLGIQPTSDVKFIPVNISVFSASQKIEVSL